MKKITKAERRLVVASVGAISLLGGVALFRMSINATPQVVIAPYPTAPVPNGYDVYVKAAKMIVPANPAVDRINDSNPPTDEKAQTQKYSLANKEAWLQQNAAGFATFQKALKLPCLVPPSRGLTEFISGAPLRQMARDKMVEVSAREMRGNWNGAIQSRLDIVQMGIDTPNGGALIASMVGMAIQAIGRNKVVSQIEKLNAPESLNATRRLEKIYARRVQFADMMAEEKYATQNQLLEMMREPEWRDVQKIDDEVTWRDRVQSVFISKTTIINRVTQFHNVQVANARLPYNSPMTPLPIAQDPYTSVFAANYDARWSVARNDAANAMWLVALALQAHKLERGSYPTSLRVLEGAYLKKVPADAFGGGESLRYKRDDASYTLWSVGPDKIDNGGRPIPHEKNVSPEQRRKPAHVNPESRGDYVWVRNQ